MNELNSSVASDARPTRSKFRPLSVNQVEVGGFFGPRIDTIAAVTADILLDRCIEARMLEQIDPDRPNPGPVLPRSHGSAVTHQMFWDSDLAKSIEAAAYALNRTPDAKLEARCDEIIDAYGRLQQEDGYLNSYFIRIEPDKRWWNLRDQHELYCAGHMMEAAVAYFYATGKRKFLDLLCRYANLIDQVFGPGDGQKKGYPGHPEIEMGLVKLGRATGEQRYLDLARFFVDQRGQEPHYYNAEMNARGETFDDFYFGTYEYCQVHKPVRDQDKVVGHAVRAAYLYAGMADVATEFGDDTLDAPLEKLWSHLTEKNLYITGGFGPSKENEGLTFDYDLPNETAYAETCAAVSLVFWASRMLGRGANARYADIMEQALYNGALSGLSQDGKTFFYDNPLESRGAHHRWTWHSCPCCPPNIARLIASVGTYFYGVAADEIAVHLYNSNRATIDLGGQSVTLTQATRYPLDGAIKLSVETDAPINFTLSLRVPAWAQSSVLTVNGAVVTAELQDGYLRMPRTWLSGDTVELVLDMAPRRVFAHPKVTQDQGRTGLMRGPLVYCLEEVDNGPDLNALVLNDSAEIETAEEDTLGGIVRLTAHGSRERWAGSVLYSTSAPAREASLLSAVPYYAWDNREPGAMLVWIRREASA